MCRLPSYSPITDLLLEDIQTSGCSGSDLTVRAYDAALGVNRKTPFANTRLNGANDRQSAMLRLTTDLRARLFRRAN
jgi:hypothetical protein